MNIHVLFLWSAYLKQKNKKNNLIAAKNFFMNYAICYVGIYLFTFFIYIKLLHYLLNNYIIQMIQSSSMQQSSDGLNLDTNGYQQQLYLQQEHSMQPIRWVWFYSWVIVNIQRYKLDAFVRKIHAFFNYLSTRVQYRELINREYKKWKNLLSNSSSWLCNLGETKNINAVEVERNFVEWKREK